MKRVVTAALLAVFVLVICTACRMVTEKQVERITDTMVQLDEALLLGKTDEALEISQAFLKDWEGIHDQLCLFLQHEHLDPLENIFSVLPYYIAQGEITLARAQCRTVETTANHILKTEHVTLHNIL